MLMLMMTGGAADHLQRSARAAAGGAGAVGAGVAVLTMASVRVSARGRLGASDGGMKRMRRGRSTIGGGGGLQQLARR